MGKTTFVNTLFTTTIKEPKNLNRRHVKPPSKTVQIQITRAGNIVSTLGYKKANENIYIYRTGRKDVQGQADHY